ncbi:MAG: PbpA [Desulfobacterales bacterium]|nr:PbpA [Desulfobacterales bacterium]
MNGSLKRHNDPLGNPSWRDYQSRLRREATLKGSVRRFSKLGLILVLALVMGYGIIGTIDGVTASLPDRDKNPPAPGPSDSPPAQKACFSKLQVQELLEGQVLVNLQTRGLDVFTAGHSLTVTTSLDPDLQNYLLQHLDRSWARYIGIVAMDPATGNILSMVGFDKTDPTGNPCVDNRFPAASIFKIVTAAAAVKKLGFDSTSPLTYNGRKHTLYKNQLKEKVNRYTRKITFRDSFAQSVNPVFGKLGALYLGKTALEESAEAFGFNQAIGFEIPLPPSEITITDEPYAWAEIASGFNRRTRISPLHGALMAAAILNKGQLVEPSIITQIKDENQAVIYRSRPAPLHQAVTPEVSEVLTRLMQATVKSGTGRKAFGGYRRDKILARLDIGGKTGSIDNQDHDARYDWFVGFAEEKQGGEKMVISVVVAHEKFIGTRASEYARLAIRHYFRNYFTQNGGRPEKPAHAS